MLERRTGEKHQPPRPFGRKDQIMSTRRTTRSAFASGAIFVAFLALAGCGSAPTYELDELDLTPAQDELIEFPLGHYEIPIPISRGFGSKAVSRNRIELAFDLHALVTRDFESQLEDLWHRHEGNIRDGIIRVCRNASLDELQEPELATLKSHLTDAVQAQLGPKTIRRLMLTEVHTRGI
jgi:hypothetical protein